MESLPFDPVSGLLGAARLLRETISWHVEDGSGHRSGTVGTVLKYILARTYLLEGVRLSLRPLQDLRALHTPEQAASCGISYRNLALVLKCLSAMAAERESLPFGHEARFADLAATLQRDAERMASSTADAGAKMRGQLLENAQAGRYLFGLDQRGRSKAVKKQSKRDQMRRKRKKGDKAALAPGPWSA